MIKSLHEPSGVDGAAFMCYEDFTRFFHTVSVCPVGTAPEAPEEDDGELEEGSDDEEDLEEEDME